MPILLETGSISISLVSFYFAQTLVTLIKLNLTNFSSLKKIRILNAVKEVEEEEEEENHQEVKKENVPQLVILDMSCKYFTFLMIIFYDLIIN